MSRKLVLTVLSAGMFLVLLDVTVVNVALPSIGRAFDARTATLQWVVDGYTVPLAGLLLVCGVLSDRYGTRRLLLLGMVGFGLGSLGCALAGTPDLLVSARAVQGIGAATLLPASMAGVSATFPEPGEQARALGIWAGVASTALPAGPVIGGLLVERFGWQAVFWVNVPVVAVMVAAVVLLLPADAARGATGRLDVAGSLASVVALASVVLALIELRRDPGAAAGAAVVAVIALVAFGYAESRAGDPILPPALLRAPGFVAANLVAASMNFVAIGSILVLTLLLQSVRGWSTLSSGLGLLPAFLPLVLLSPVTGRLVARYGVRPPMVAGLLIGAAGSAALLGVGRGGGYWPLLPTLLGIGIGLGLLTAAVVTAAVRAVPPARRGLASGVNNAARQAGGSIGIAAYGALVGDPHDQARFLSGLHVAGAVGAITWLAAAGLTALAVGRRPPS